MKTSIKCIIVDDEPLAIKILERYTQEMTQLELLASFENAISAFDFLKKTPVDLIFLDINLPLLSGIDFARSLIDPPKIILTTAYRNYAVESYELNVIDYLLKPISFERFFSAVHKYLDLNNNHTESFEEVSRHSADHIFVNTNKKYVRIAYSEILYIESIRDYIRIHTTGQNIITKDKISVFATKLPPNFLRIHRSFIVNSNKVTAFTALHLEVNEIRLSIGSSYKQEVIEHLQAG